MNTTNRDAAPATHGENEHHQTVMMDAAGGKVGGGGDPNHGGGSSKANDSRDAVYQQAARAYCRTGDIFIPIFQVVNAGVRWDIARDTAMIQNHPTVSVAPPVTDEEVKAIVSTT